MADRQIVVAFDLYGTLLSTSSIANHLEKYFGQQAQSLSTLVRQYQLEYTWRLNSMGTHHISNIQSIVTSVHTDVQAGSTPSPT